MLRPIKGVPEMRKIYSYITIQLYRHFLCLPLFLSLAQYNLAHCGGLSDLDSKTRLSIREAQLEAYGNNGSPTKSGNQAGGQGPAVVINDTVDATGKKKCIMNVGKVISSQKLKGTKQENITYVDGNVVNVCE